MAILDIFYQQYLEGKVLDKYRLENGNIGVIVENSVDRQRHHVEFNDGKPELSNLYGFFKTPFEKLSDSLDKLITKGNYVGVTLSFNRSPFKQARQLHKVSSAPSYRTQKNSYRNLVGPLWRLTEG